MQTFLRAPAVNMQTSELHDTVYRENKPAQTLDDEEAELGVGCIGALICDAAGQEIAGLSVSAPIERR